MVRSGLSPIQGPWTQERGPVLWSTSAVPSNRMGVLGLTDVPPGGGTRPGSWVLGLCNPHTVVLGASETALSSSILSPGAALLWTGAWGGGVARGRLFLWMEQDARASRPPACAHGGRSAGRSSGPRQAARTQRHVRRACRRNSTCGPGLPGDGKVYLPRWEDRTKLDRLLV